MQYNKSKLYLYLCISAFFLILATTLFYSFGYKYDFETGKSFQTGAIVLKAVPKEVIITKDGEEVKQSGLLNGIFSSFVKIEDLETKNYNIKVAKDGYNEWQKNIAISAGQVAKFENVVLLKKSYENLPVLETTALPDRKNIWLSALKNRLIFRGAVGEVDGLYLIDLENEQQKLLLDKTQLGLMGEVQNVQWGVDDSKIVVNTASNLYVVDLGDNNKTYLISAAVAKILSQNAYFVYDKFVVYVQSGVIYSFNYNTKETKKVLDSVSSFSVYQGSLYFFKAGDVGGASLFVTDYNDSSQVIKVSRMPAGYDAKQSFTIQKDGNSTTVLTNGILYLIDRDGKTQKINSNVKEARFFQGGKRIIYFNDNEIWIYYVENKAYQPIKVKGDNELLARFSGKLSNVYIYSDDEHIFFQEENALNFTEMDGRDNRNSFKLMDNPDGQDLFYVRSKNLVYFIKGSKLFKLDLKEA